MQLIDVEWYWTGRCNGVFVRNCVDDAYAESRRRVSRFARAQVRSSRILSTPGAGRKGSVRKVSVSCVCVCVFIVQTIRLVSDTHNFYRLYVLVFLLNVGGLWVGCLSGDYTLVLVLNNTVSNAHIFICSKLLCKKKVLLNALDVASLPHTPPHNIPRVYSFQATNNRKTNTLM